MICINIHLLYCFCSITTVFACIIEQNRIVWVTVFSFYVVNMCIFIYELVMDIIKFKGENI